MRELTIAVAFLKICSWTVLVSHGPICGHILDILNLRFWGGVQHTWVLTSVLNFENHCVREYKWLDLLRSHTDWKGRAGNWLASASNASLPIVAHFLLLGSQITCNSVQSHHSVMSSSATQRTAACQASLSITTPGACSNPCSSRQRCYSTISSFVIPSPPALSLSQHQGLFKWVSSSHQVAKVLELQHQSFQWIFRNDFLWIDWLNLLAVQGTLKSLLQHNSSKALIFWCSAFFMVQLSYPYTSTGKTTALTRQTFVGKVMSLLFNMLSGLVIAFLPKSKRLLISWLQSLPAVILEPKKIVCHCFHCFPIYLPWSDQTRCQDFSFLSFKPTFSLSSFTFIKRLFSSSSLSAIRVVSSVYLRLLIFLLAILIPACASSSQAFRMMYSAHKLNKDVLLFLFGSSPLFHVQF